MTLNQLPDQPTPLPLSDPQSIAEALDLLVPPDARANGALLVLLCDEQRRPLVPVLIDDLNTMPPAQMPRMLTALADQVAGHVQAGDLTALVALARRGPLTPNGTDRRWARTIREAFRGRVPVFGVHLITFEGSAPLPDIRHAA